MIRSFRGEDTRLICEGKWVPDRRNFYRPAHVRLRLLEAATSLEDLAQMESADLRFNAGDRKGQYSLLIIEKWRVYFEWPEGAAGPEKVQILDAG